LPRARIANGMPIIGLMALAKRSIKPQRITNV
jgi:hypothetical protein